MDWTRGLVQNWTPSTAVFITESHSSHCVIASKLFTCTAANADKLAYSVHQKPIIVVLVCVK